MFIGKVITRDVLVTDSPPSPPHTLSQGTQEVPLARNRVPSKSSGDPGYVCKREELFTVLMAILDDG